MFARLGSRIDEGPWLRSFETRKTSKRPVSKNKKIAMHWHLSQRMSQHKQLGLGTLWRGFILFVRGILEEASPRIRDGALMRFH